MTTEQTTNENVKNETGELLLTETVRARSELLEIMWKHSDRLFNFLNINILLIGLFSTTAFYSYSFHPPHLIPLGISVCLLIGGLFFGLYGMLPRGASILMNPDTLYKLKIDDNETKETVIDKLLQTYLCHQKELIPKCDKKPFFIKIDIMILFASLLAYSFSWVVLASNLDLFPTIVGTSCIILAFSILCIIFYHYFKKEKERNEYWRYRMSEKKKPKLPDKPPIDTTLNGTAQTTVPSKPKVPDKPPIDSLTIQLAKHDRKKSIEEKKP